MNNTYTIKSNNLKEVLTKIETIIENLKTFSNKHYSYIYNTKIININNQWNAEVNIHKNEKQINNKILKEIS